MTSTSVHRTPSNDVSKTIRKIRGGGWSYVTFTCGLLADISGQACREIIGWTMRTVKSAMTVNQSSRRGGESIIAGYAVSSYRRALRATHSLLDRANILLAVRRLDHQRWDADYVALG